MTGEQLIPIGRFAQRCRLSVKRLRHYDDLGLLTPAKVDPATGYRYYRAEQARDALAIALLRRLDMPLDDIAKVLSGDLAGPLETQRERLEAEIAHKKATLRATEKLLARGLHGPEVSVVHAPARRLRVVRAQVEPGEFGAAFPGCVGALVTAFAQAGVAWRKPVYGLYPLDVESGTVTMAVGIEIEDTREVPSTEPQPLPAGPRATVTHLGPYEDISLSYHALLTWIHEHGHEPRGPAVEAYLTDPADSAPEELVTRISIGIEEN